MNTLGDHNQCVRHLIIWPPPIDPSSNPPCPLITNLPSLAVHGTHTHQNMGTSYHYCRGSGHSGKVLSCTSIYKPNSEPQTHFQPHCSLPFHSILTITLIHRFQCPRKTLRPMLWVLRLSIKEPRILDSWTSSGRS